MTVNDILKKLADGEIDGTDEVKVPGVEKTLCLTDEEKSLLVDALDNYCTHLDMIMKTTVEPITNFADKIKDKINELIEKVNA